MRYRFIVFFFFFSSRRRHTRSYGDWSSDVCSSDLEETARRLGYAGVAWVGEAEPWRWVPELPGGREALRESSWDRGRSNDSADTVQIALAGGGVMNPAGRDRVAEVKEP